MPKKYQAENPKARAAKERKLAAKNAQKPVQDDSSDDNDKLLQKKQQKKQEKEKKREAQLRKKAENKHLLEQETENNSRIVTVKTKITKAQIESSQVNEKKCIQPSSTFVRSIPENTNKLLPVEEKARSVDEAIEILAEKPNEIDKHPEKRRKAAFKAFQAKRLNELKLEKSDLRLSQLQDIVFKEWQKSPENPTNTA